MYSGTIVVKDRVPLPARLHRIDSTQLTIPSIRLRILIIQPPKPDPVVFSAKGENITQGLPGMKTKAAGRAPVGYTCPSVCITAIDADLPLISWLGRKRICIIQEFIVLSKPSGRNKGGVPDIITAAHRLGIGI